MLLMFVAAALAATAPGKLVIVGGALDVRNDAVFETLAGALTAETPDVVIVPAASGVPARSAQAFARDLARHGVAPARILTARLAMIDDPDTPDVDESAWRGGASDPREIAKLTHAGMIWFVGGDQARVIATLVRADGSDTPMLAAIRARLAAGAMIGGSSAGAAIMSAPMIGGGDTIGALWPASARMGEELKPARGLGFLAHGLVDQHFDTRARLGRLVVALSQLPKAERIGFGIDENTALVVDLATRRATAIGAGSVTILDARQARFAAGGRFAASHVALGLAGGGDAIDLASGAITPAPYKSVIAPDEEDAMPIAGGGMAIPAGATSAILRALIDAKPVASVDRLSVAGGFGVRFRFAKTAGTHAWSGRDAAGTARATFSGFEFAIQPLDVAIREAGGR